MSSNTEAKLEKGHVVPAQDNQASFNVKIFVVLPYHQDQGASFPSGLQYSDITKKKQQI